MDYSLLLGVRRKTFVLSMQHGKMSASAVASSSLKPFMLSASTHNNKNDDNSDNNTKSSAKGRDVGDEGETINPITAPNDGNFKGRIISNHEVDAPEVYQAAAVEGCGSFYIGIIDCLQDWNWSKLMERYFKIYLLRKDADGLSAIDPVSYRKRFLQRAVLDIFAAVHTRPNDTPASHYTMNKVTETYDDIGKDSKRLSKLSLRRSSDVKKVSESSGEHFNNISNIDDICL